jgi:multidrug efflux pump subunit AcrA (membrane-fusion protein)
VVAKVHESRIGFISPGQSTQLQLDSLMEISLTGTVTEVSEYPLPPISSYMSHVKEYPVSIQIDNPPRDLRPGMTAQARILIESLEDVLQIPIESVIEREDRYFCAIPDVEGKLELREITVGSVNDTNLVVSSGLEEGELVVLNVGDADIISSLDVP